MSGRTRLIVVLSVLFVGGLALSLVIAWHFDDWGGFWLNLGTELVGAVATYSLFELFVERRGAIESEKARLIAELGSSVKDVAVAAAEKLRQRGWLDNGSLYGANLEGANLERADLTEADLREAILIGANLRGASLAFANLETAVLGEANLREAILAGANLRGAGLAHANLETAVLAVANLEGVNLGDANLRGANLTGANLENATLPNLIKWTPDTDMARFTDPDHPDFWRYDPH